MTNNVIDDVCNAVENAGVNILLQLPCDRIAPLLFELNKRFSSIPLTREEEGVGIAAGVVLGGAKPLMLVQSSGFGNMVNAVMSLIKIYQLPLPIIISHRGIYKENIPAQVPMGKHLPAILDAIEVPHQSYSSIADLSNLSFELENVFKDNIIKFFLFSPRLFEDLPKPTVEEQMKNISRTLLKREDVVEEKVIIEGTNNPKSRIEMLGELKDYLNNKAVLCNMGYPSRELFSIFDQSSNFYMLGSLGLVSSIGLGVALFSKKEVVVLDGDGSLLMNPNALLSIGSLQPSNLTIICLDNGTYGSTGDQPTLAATGVQLDQLAKACGIPKIMVTDSAQNISSLTGPGPNFIRLVVKPGNAKVGTIELTALEIKNRFQDWLHG